MSLYFPWIIMLIGLFGLLIFGIASWRSINTFDWTLVYPELSGVSRKKRKQKIEEIIEKDEREGINSDEIASIYYEKRYSAIANTWMPTVLSLLVVLSALYVILSKDMYPDAQQKWAFGVVGTVLGYWFKR